MQVPNNYGSNLPLNLTEPQSFVNPPPAESETLSKAFITINHQKAKVILLKTPFKLCNISQWSKDANCNAISFSFSSSVATLSYHKVLCKIWIKINTYEYYSSSNMQKIYLLYFYFLIFLWRDFFYIFWKTLFVSLRKKKQVFSSSKRLKAVFQM